MIAAGVVFLGLLLFSPAGHLVVGAFNDDGVYLSLGRAIARGDGYRSIYAPGDPVHEKYPPGLPLILALFWSVGGSLGNVVVLFRIVNAALVATTAGTVWWYGRTVLQAPPSLLALFSIGPFFLEASLEYQSVAIAEPYLMLGWATSLVLASRVAAQPPDRRRLVTAGFLGVVLAATLLFRTQGIVLIPAILLALAVERDGWRPTAVCVAAALVPWSAWRLVHRTWMARGPVSDLPDEVSSYLEWIPLGDPGALGGYMLRVVGENVVGYLRMFSNYASSVDAVGYLVVGSVGALAVVGAIRLPRRHAALAWSVVAMLAVMLIWPFTQDRLVLPALPFIGLLAATAACDGLGRISVPGRRAVVAGLLLSGGLLALRQSALRADALSRVESGQGIDYFSPTYILAQNSRYLERVSTWVLRNTTMDDRILVEYPSGVYLLTGRKAVNSAPAESRHSRTVFSVPGRYLAERILHDGITVVVVGNLRFAMARDVAVVARECPGFLAQFIEDSTTLVPLYLRVQGDTTCLIEKFVPGTASIPTAP